ncbi:MAG TPA: dihydrofolate reductase [Pseudorhodoplanes sp.]|nr:dihydrofolate reductase [Pseudorhodoplanes sp.]
MNAARAADRRIETIIVAAIGENGVIGRDNTLPWRLKSDLQYFRAVTMGKPVVMGRKTYVSIGKPLPGRTNIVVTRDASFSAPGVVTAPSVPEAMRIARKDAQERGADAIAVIGGTEIFAQTIADADRLVLTRVHMNPEGEATFPDIDPQMWREIERREQPPGPGDDCGFTYLTYIRAGAA